MRLHLLLYGVGWLTAAGWTLYQAETDDDVPPMLEAYRQWWPLLTLGISVFWPILVVHKVVKLLTGKSLL